MRIRHWLWLLPILIFPLPVVAAEWTPAPVSHAEYQCDYYPNQQVFYCPKDYLYYWLDGMVWKASHLGVPDWITLGKKVTVTLDEPKPYYQYSKIAKEYPPTKK